MNDDKEKFLKERGWSTWYNINYWVNPKVIADSNAQDYTNYGMSIEDAYQFEINNHPPFEPHPLGFIPGAVPKLDKIFTNKLK